MSKVSVLVVEDEAIVAADLAGKLRQLGYEVPGIASGGEEAITLAAKFRPDLVVMDIRLEGSLDGIEAAEAIRSRHDVPVIYLTAHSDAATLARAKVTGPFGYILKPFEERDLATQIELALYKHQADREITHQREWLRVTLTSIGDAVIATDAEGRITFVNPVAEMLIGWKGGEALDLPLSSVFHIVDERTGEPMADPVGRVLREGRPVPLANHAALMTRDGRTVPIEDSAAPILDTEGRLLGAVLVFHDVTEKRRAEEALQQAHQRLEKVLGSITNGYYALDAGWRLVALNPFAEHHFGRHAAELIGKSIWEIMNVSPEEELFRRFHEARESGQPLRFEAKSTNRPGFWAELHLYPQDGTLEVYFSDISARKRAEEALRASEELNRRTMQALPAHIAVLDREGRILAVNERWVEFAARNGAAGSPEVLAGANYLEICRRAAVENDDLANKALAGIQAVLHGASEQFTMEYPCHAPTEKRWFFMSVASLGSGGVEGAVVTHLNITERKQAEDALRESEERLRFHRERMPIGCIVHDEEFRFVELNPAAERILGYRAEELIGQHVRVIVPPEAQPHVEGILRRLASGDMTAHSVNENITRDGRIILCDWMNTPLKDSDGKLLGLLSIFQDVTEHKRAEDRLRESEARYRELVQHANSAIIRWRADGTISFFNEYAQDFFGWSSAEIIGEHVSILVPEQESSGTDLRGLVQDIVDHPDQYVKNINENVCRDGRRVWMTWTNQALRDELGRVTEILAIGSDITDRKRAEEVLRESESQFRLLSKTAARLLEAEYPLRVVSELAHQVMEHLDCQAFFNFVVDDHMGKLHLNAFAGIPDEEAQRIEWLDYGVAVCGCVARDGVRIVAEDICTVADPRTELVKSYGIQAYACHPLMAAGKVIGTLSFGTKSRCCFSPRDLDLMKTVADQVAVAMERMRLLAALEKSRNELEVRVKTRTAQLVEANQELREGARALVDSEERLRRNIGLLQKVFDGITDPLLMLDDCGRVTMINRAAMSYYGVGEGADVLGKPCYEGLRGREAACQDCRYPFPVAGPRTMSFERSGLNGPGRVENVTVYPVLDEDGERDAVIVRVSDITQAKVLEKQILQNEKLAALGLVTSGIAHEINNPNSFIYFNLPILRSYLEELMPIVDEHAALHPGFQVQSMSYGEFREDMFRLLENMEHGSQRINKTIGVLRSFVRKRDVEGMQRVDLKQLVEKVVALCHTELRQKVSSFEILVPDDLPSIVSDPDALEQVLLNLLINAIHACDKPDSRVKLKVEGARPGRDQITIEVTDNGSGIEEAVREKIFDPFFTTKAPSAGTGLGLYICHNHVTCLGGRIDVESEVGEGTTFRVVLPPEGQTAHGECTHGPSAA